MAAARRLSWAVSPTALDPELLLERLKKSDRASWPRIRAVLAARIGGQWEGDVLTAAGDAESPATDGMLLEQILEYDWLVRRWDQVPRVCASIALKAGFLFACVAILQQFVPSEGIMGGAALSALNALSIGIAAAAFCAAVHVRARPVVNRRMAARDRLVDRIRDLLGPEEGQEAGRRS